MRKNIKDSERSRIKTKPKKRGWKFKLFAIFLSFVILIMMGSGLWAITFLPKDLPSIKAFDEYKPSPGTKIFSDEDELVTEFHEERRIFMPLAQIPPVMKQAIIAVEDDRFYTHYGISLKGIARALWHNFKGGKVLEGGSTITQQLAKVLFLTPDKSLSRKMKEMIIAFQLEKKYSKDRILELYLNHIYFGHGSFGVEAAARTYFGKSVSELNLSEAALLAGLPRAPKIYSPFEKSETAKKRRNHVINRMSKLNFITQAVATKASAAPLGVIPPEKRKTTGQYFLEYIRQILEDKYENDTLYKAGLNVYTTINPKMQLIAELAIREGLKELEDRTTAKPVAQKGIAPAAQPKRETHPEGALVSIEPQTGYIKAMVGGYDFTRSEFNRAVNAKRQPGSGFKPFVYTAAIDSGLPPTEMVEDAPVSYTGKEGEEWKPENYTRDYKGLITYQRALEESINVATVKVLEKVGVRKAIDIARRMGIKSPLTEDLTLALGSSDVTLLELTSAYSVLPNHGIRMEPKAIRYITDSNGKLLEENIPQGEEILRPEVAYVVTHMMKGVVERGTGWKAKVLNRPIAAKTGTTNDYSNAWFTGFTPDLITGVWVGYDKPKSLGPSETGSRVAVPIWIRYMQQVLANTPSEDFPVPEKVVFASIDADTGLLATRNCQNVIKVAFIEGTEPTQYCPIHRSPSEMR